jgi:hypothetical protein
MYNVYPVSLIPPVFREETVLIENVPAVGFDSSIGLFGGSGTVASSITMTNVDASLSNDAENAAVEAAM